MRTGQVGYARVLEDLECQGNDPGEKSGKIHTQKLAIAQWRNEESRRILILSAINTHSGRGSVWEEMLS